MSAKPPVVKSLHLRNYRSVRDETVFFDNPLFLVGRNGSGKSNVTDALAFLADCMTLPFQTALDKRYGIIHLNATPEAPSVLIEIQLDEGSYGLRFRYLQNQGMVVEEELGSWNRESFRRTEERVVCSVPGISPRLTAKGLTLPILGGVDAFSGLFTAIASIHLHHINHQAIRINESSGSSRSPFLEKDGANLGSVLPGYSPETKQKVNRWLNKLVGMSDVTAYETNEGKTILGFGQTWPGHSVMWVTANVSDGTLNAAGLIVALLQEPTPSVIIIEEPETNLHPGVLNVVSEMIQDAAERTQVIITTHSPDLLDAKWLCPENLRLVSWNEGSTTIHPLGMASKSALQEHLMYAGQLLRANALDP